MTEYLKGTVADNEDILDFCNYVFSHDGTPTDFVKLVPKYYKKGNEAPNEHFLVKENSKIKSVIGSFNLQMDILGEKIKTAGIGSVSVHPYSRGSGYMKKLMQAAREEMKANGADISILGGQRQRYEHFGYEPAGVEMTYSVNTSNLRHYAGEIFAVSFKQVTESDTDAVEYIKQLHQKQPLTLDRCDKKYYDILISWDSEVYLIEYQGKSCGYFTCNKSYSYISELELEDMKLLPSVIKEFFSEFSCRSVSLSSAEFECEKTSVLAQICEGYKVGCNYQYAVFNFKKVVSALLKLKASYTRLSNGKASFKIVNTLGQYGTAEEFTVAVKDNEVKISEEVDSECIELDYLEAIRLLFSPSAYFDIKAKSFPDCVKNWIPLPIYVFRQDGI